MDTIVKITLVVKGDAPDVAEEVRRRIDGALVEWYTEAAPIIPGTGFPDGTLLWYRWDAERSASGYGKRQSEYAERGRPE